MEKERTEKLVVMVKSLSVEAFYILKAIFILYIYIRILNLINNNLKALEQKRN